MFICDVFIIVMIFVYRWFIALSTSGGGDGNDTSHLVCYLYLT